MIEVKVQMTRPSVIARHDSAEAISVDGCWGLPRTFQVLAMTKKGKGPAMTNLLCHCEADRVSRSNL